MTPVFVDTSALLAFLDADDESHPEAVSHWHRLLDGIAAGEFQGVTHYGVVVETSALVQRRLGMDALERLHGVLLGALAVEWVDEVLHGRATAAMLGARHRRVSLVDWTSFELIRTGAIHYALAFDSDFDDRGFRLPWE